MSHQVLVDWLSFSVDAPAYSSIPRGALLSSVVHACDRGSLRTIPKAIFAADWQEGPGRAPYAFRFTSPETGCTLFGHESFDHVLCELSGRGCALLTELGGLQRVAAAVAGRCTRLDLAVDMETDVNPDEFIAKRLESRFDVCATYASRSGKTCYIGSMHSDRYARVYRYSDPLPRSHLLRAEHVFRRGWARSACRLVASEGPGALARYCGGVWKWTHPTWSVGSWEAERVLSREIATRAPNTLLWLLEQVFPAMRRLAREGTIVDLRSFVEQYLFVDESTGFPEKEEAIHVNQAVSRE